MNATTPESVVLEPARFGVVVTRFRLLSALAVVIGLAAYTLGPVLDERIPVVFRHIDWVSYSEAAGRFLRGEPVYIAAQLQGPYRMADIAGLGYVYPPPSILLFVPFRFLGPTVWAVMNAGLFAAGIAAMARRDFGRFAGLAFGGALLAVGLTAPYLDAMVMGNANLAVAGLFAWAWALGRGSRPIGWLAGLGGLIKLHPLALAGWARPATAVRSMTTALGVVLIVAMVTLPIVGVARWLDFAKAAANARPLCGYGLNAAACTLEPVLGGFTVLILLAIAGLLVLAAIWSPIDLASFALLVVAVLLPHPEIFSHTLLLLEVLLFAVVGTVVRRRLAPADGAVSIASARL